MSPLFAQVVTPPEGLDSGLLMPLWVLLVLYLIAFLAGRVLEAREHPRAETVEDAGFAVLLIAAVYALVMLVIAIASQFELVADMVEIVAIMVGFFGLLVTALLGIELLVGLAGRGRRRGAEVPPPSASPASKD